MLKVSNNHIILQKQYAKKCKKTRKLAFAFNKKIATITILYVNVITFENNLNWRSVISSF